MSKSGHITIKQCGTEMKKCSDHKFGLSMNEEMLKVRSQRVVRLM